MMNLSAKPIYCHWLETLLLNLDGLRSILKNVSLLPPISPWILIGGMRLSSLLPPLLGMSLLSTMQMFLLHLGCACLLLKICVANYHFLLSGFFLRTEWAMPLMGHAGAWLASDVDIF